MFDSLLLGEIAELKELVASMELRWRRRCERGIDKENRPPEGIVRMRGRVLEAQQLLDALRARFPVGVSGSPPCDRDPLTEIQTDGVHTPVAAASRA
jgi:hypothetical protein